MHDSGVGKYLKNAPASPLSASGSMGKYLEPSNAKDAEKPHEANYRRVFSDQHSGGIGRYVQDSTK